jgi:hypothetical protein
MTEAAVRRGRWGKMARGTLVVLLVVTGAGAALFYRWLDAKRRGPPVPVCAGAPLTHKAFMAARQLTTKKSPGVYGNEPAAALLPSGTLAIVYQAQVGFFSDNSLGLLRLSPDGRIDEGTLKVDRKRHFDAWMVADPEGTLHLAFMPHDGGPNGARTQVRTATSRDGITWLVGPEAHDVAHDCPGETPGCMDKPMIAWVDGAPLVLYYSEMGEGGVRAVRLDANGHPTAPSVRAGSGAYGDVSVSPSGAVHVVYVTWTEPGVNRYGDARISVEMARSDDGGRSFSPPTRVSAEGEIVPFFFSNSQIAFDDRRNALYVVYPTGRSDGPWEIRLATSFDGGKTWKRRKLNDDSSCANHMTPRAVLDPKTGKLHVIWLENRTGRGGVAYTACDPGGERCDPNEAVSDTPFSAYTLNRHRSDWVGEYPALVLDPQRRHLHAVWSQTVDEDGEPVARLFHAGPPCPIDAGAGLARPLVRRFGGAGVVLSVGGSFVGGAGPSGGGCLWGERRWGELARAPGLAGWRARGKAQGRLGPGARSRGAPREKGQGGGWDRRLALVR